MKKGISVKAKTLLFQLVIPVLLFLFIAAFLFVANFKQLYEDQKVILEFASTSIRDALQIEVQKSFSLIRAVSSHSETAEMVQAMDSVPTGLDNDDYRNLEGFENFRQYLDSSTSMTSADLLYVAGLKSTGIMVNEDIQIAEGFDVKGRDYYKGALANPGIPFISDPRVSAQQSAVPILTITAAIAVVDESGKPVGIVAMNYSLNSIIEILKNESEGMAVQASLYSSRDPQNIFEIWSPGNTQAEIESGGRFYNPDQPLSLDVMASELGYENDRISDLLANVFNEPSYYFEGKTEGGLAMMQTQHVPGADWLLSVSESQRRIYSELSAKLLPPIITLVIVFILVQLGGFILTVFSVLRPLSGVGYELEKLTEADADLTVAIDVRNRDEIGQVGLYFNGFVEKLRNLILDVKKAVDATDSVKNSITASSEETSTAIEQISGNLESIKNQIDNLDSNINTTVTSIEQITSNTGSIDDQITNQAAMIEESSAAITEMIASLESVAKVTAAKKEATGALSKVADEGKTRIEETSQRFKDVVDQIADIQTMATTINGIASQTNLLSMNAAIEAAHAGDAGRGFAVVAEEIRKLAETAGTSADSITQLIKNITESVRITDENVSLTSKAFESIAREVEDTVNAFNEIGQSVDELNTGGRQIQEATEQVNSVTMNIQSESAEIKEGTESMLRISTEIRNVSSQVTSGMSESLSGAREIVQSGQEMLVLSQSLQKIVTELKEKFGAFRT